MKISEYEQEIEKKKILGSQAKSSGGGGGGGGGAFTPMRASELPIPRSKISSSTNSITSPLRKATAVSHREDNRYTFPLIFT